MATMKQIRKAIEAQHGKVQLRFEVMEDGSIKLQIYKLVRERFFRWVWCGSVDEFVRQSMGFLPLHEDVEDIQYHRPPTVHEITFGEGATHYATFDLEDCCHEGTRIPKQWFVSAYDGLKYYR
jgi:hypothetical protein